MQYSQSIISVKKMNQILQTPQNKQYLFFFKLLLSISLLIIIICSIITLYAEHQNNVQAKVSELILNTYTISKLYSTSILTYIESDSPYIIGTLEIPKISLCLPIISQMDDNLLAISACRFYGPFPNTARQYLYCKS